MSGLKRTRSLRSSCRSQRRSSSLEHEEPEPRRIKVEEEELEIPHAEEDPENTQIKEEAEEPGNSQIKEEERIFTYEDRNLETVTFLQTMDPDSQPEMRGVDAEQEVKSDDPDVPSAASSTQNPATAASSPRPGIQRGRAKSRWRQKNNQRQREELSLGRANVKILKQAPAYDDDALEIFGKYLASEMRLIKDPVANMQLRQKITRLLDDARSRNMSKAKQT